MVQLVPLTHAVTLLKLGLELFFLFGMKDSEEKQPASTPVSGKLTDIFPLAATQSKITSIEMVMGVTLGFRP